MSLLGYLTDYHWQWYAVVGFPMLLFCLKWVQPRFGLPASLLLATCAYSAMQTWIVVNNRYTQASLYDQVNLKLFACQEIARIMLVAVPMMVFSKERHYMRAVGCVACSLFVIASSLVSIWEARNGCSGNRCGGLIGNPSISMGFMVCLLPTFIHSWKKQFIPLTLACVAVFLSQSSVATGVLAAYVCLHLFPQAKDNVFGYTWKAVAACAVVFGFMAYGSSKALVHDSGRYNVWTYMFDRWRAPWNIPTGTGLGTYHVLSVHLQRMAPAAEHGIVDPANGWWLTLHNSWLQMLFECGAVGFLLLLATYCSALFKVIKENDWQIAMAIALFGIYMFLNPALQNPLPFLFGAWLFAYALRKSPKEYYESPN